MASYKGSFKDYDERVYFCVTDEQKDKICERLMTYYAEHAYIGEVIHQDDGSIIEAPSVMSDICDNIIKFKNDIPVDYRYDINTGVRSTKIDVDQKNQWAIKAREERSYYKWGRPGVVVGVHDSHGLYYDVKHEDGSICFYHHEELEQA